MKDTGVYEAVSPSDSTVEIDIIDQAASTAVLPVVKGFPAHLGELTKIYSRRVDGNAMRLEQFLYFEEGQWYRLALDEEDRKRRVPLSEGELAHYKDRNSYTLIGPISANEYGLCKRVA